MWWLAESSCRSDEETDMLTANPHRLIAIYLKRNPNWLFHALRRGGCEFTPVLSTNVHCVVPYRTFSWYVLPLRRPSLHWRMHGVVVMWLYQTRCTTDQTSFSFDWYNLSAMCEVWCMCDLCTWCMPAVGRGGRRGRWSYVRPSRSMSVHYMHVLTVCFVSLHGRLSSSPH